MPESKDPEDAYGCMPTKSIFTMSTAGSSPARGHFSDWWPTFSPAFGEGCDFEFYFFRRGMALAMPTCTSFELSSRAERDRPRAKRAAKGTRSRGIAVLFFQNKINLRCLTSARLWQMWVFQPRRGDCQ